MTINLLAVCGSLREASSNRALLDAARRLQPDDVLITRYERLAGLPHFSPDLEADALIPEEVTKLRSQVAVADGLLIACPEYMHCLPGSFKNMLDWLVGCESFPGKPVALFQATARHEFVPALLRDVLTTMNAALVERACFTLPASSNVISSSSLVEDLSVAAEIRTKLDLFASHIRERAR